MNGAGGATDLLYVTDAAHGSAALVDGRAGRIVVVPVPLGIGSPLGVARSNGSAIVAVGETDPYCLTRVARLLAPPSDGSSGGVAGAGAAMEWLQPLPESACAATLATSCDVALVAYALRHAWRQSSYEPALLSAAEGALVARLGIGGPRDLVTGVWWEHLPGGSVAWCRCRRQRDRRPSGRAHPGTMWGRWNELGHALHFRLSGRWDVTRFNRTTLALLDQADLPHAPRWLGASPDRAVAYVTAALGGSPDGSLVTGLDFSSMAAATLGHVPVGRPGGIAATADALYVSDPRRGLVWATGRESGSRFRALRFRALRFRAGGEPSALCAVTVS